MNPKRRGLFTVVVVSTLAILACSPLGGGAGTTKNTAVPAASIVPQSAEATATPAGAAGTPTTVIGSAATPGSAATAPGAATVSEATEVGAPTYDSAAAQTKVPPLLTASAATAGAATGALRQWAASATASSQYSDPAWDAAQATGAPNSPPTCGDQQTAWASASADGVDYLELVYTTTVVPAAVNIYETNSPGSIVKVDLEEDNGTAHTIYTGLPLTTQLCPRTFAIGVSGITAHVKRVKIYMDQSAINAWDEIDAVELVGNP